MLPRLAPGPLRLALAAALLVASARALASTPGGEIELRPDTLVLQSGRTLAGRLLFEDDETLVFRVRSREQRILVADVAEVHALRRELPLALDEISSLAAHDRDGHVRLAAQLEQRGLPFEARLLYWRALLVDPRCDAAHEALGHKRSGADWRIPHGKRGWPLDVVRRKGLEWSEPFEFRTTHFALKANVELELAIDIALELEHIYRRVLELFGPSFELWEVVEPMTTWVHGDTISFPEIGDGRTGFFALGDARVHVQAVGGLDWRTLVHETVHQVLWSSGWEQFGRRVDLPGWLDEGLAQLVEVSYARVSGRAGTARLQLLRTQAMHEDPFELERVLNFRTPDFTGSPRSHLMYAQSFSLVDFLWNGATSQQRAGFADFARGSFEGASSRTHFKKALGLRKESELEAVWLEWVQLQARG